MECPTPQCNDLSRSVVAFQQDNTLVAVVELSRSSWLVAGLVPGIGRHPLKKLDPSEGALLALLRRWRDEAAGAGKPVIPYPGDQADVVGFGHQWKSTLPL